MVVFWLLKTGYGRPLAAFMGGQRLAAYILPFFFTLYGGKVLEKAYLP
ncbi:hypothetical protein ACFLFF_16350 [Brevibacillus reuszeri]